MPGRAILFAVSAVMVLALAGCGGKSLKEKVADKYDTTVRSCTAIGIADGAKIYSCQTENSTLCVIVDGSDVIDARAKAQEQGIAC